jgi:ferritin-like metal-binding protein YciE
MPLRRRPECLFCRRLIPGCRFATVQFAAAWDVLQVVHRLPTRRKVVSGLDGRAAGPPFFPAMEQCAMKMKTLSDLLIHELKDLYSAEKQLTKALPKLVKAATNENLKQALEDHLDETERQVERLDEIFGQLDASPRGPKCAAMEGLVEEGKKILEEEMDDDVRDAAIIAAAQRVEHYEIAGYGSARTFAQQLGHDKVAAMLQETLDEEKAADEKLTEIALQSVNEAAEV